MIFKPQTFHGEEPVVANETPIGAMPVDAILEEEAAQALALTEGVDATALTVTASKGEIFLLGRIGSREEIDRAIEALLAVPGVRKVTVQLETEDLP
ncbi:BON domain-containing protein [Rhizobium sp. AAP43]|uniref:BON domain-containing protein n=1 Tax=Rhizobium sp. AAP43 TaxID=1523420 RepID=UPI0006B95F07|nr:BON domain-containing protein [Rhizobium sp. AAP43]KPF42083.1 hypothetical protein IP76_18450 [Rhizobium sp. AAP43]